MSKELQEMNNQELVEYGKELQAILCENLSDKNLENVDNLIAVCKALRDRGIV